MTQIQCRNKHFKNIYYYYSIFFYTFRQERQRKPDKPEDFVLYEDSDSDVETPAQQQRILRTSYNFVDFVRSRELQLKEVKK